ncbi:2-oxoglutarate (2OG) and Fe(II)-dependent oxygenase superfamily protein [Artemisia annua]|uniref:2-oxoglutarate (2OG) and Fe(II)-dependent oxygenase superfamily protein n=1 Tax=Artemisia annua TaxID=35608 RepID=A0A2U1KA20_ARTAN|nr:2-oxoglutarate (2OG) and Fe(II)-dependent oxygenase superfamily protein [Artemisia annua]
MTFGCREQKHKEYRQKIISNYQPLYRELYTMNSSMFFVPSFHKAFSNPDKDQSIKDIISQPAPGVVTFDMLQPRFCEMLLSEVENFEKWVHETKFRIMRPNTMNKYGAVLDDFGLEGTLGKLMEEFVRHISKGTIQEQLAITKKTQTPFTFLTVLYKICAVYFADVGGFALDSHHGFVVEYGMDRDVELGFHVDDSEVTLNVCLGKQFTGGDLFFRGVRCEKHVNGPTYRDEIFDYSHSVGRAILHRGRHRHGARATTSGNRVNLLLWCRSSVFRELKKYKKDFLNFCGECQKEKEARLVHTMAAWKQRFCILLTRFIGSTTWPSLFFDPFEIKRRLLFWKLIVCLFDVIRGYLLVKEILLRLESLSDHEPGLFSPLLYIQVS